MKLRDMEVRPGEVLQVVDNFGTAKVSCPGFFNKEDEFDKLPPAIPLFKTSSTSFCQPHEGDKVLVWVNKTNPLQIYYTFLGDVKANNEGTLEYGNADIEILSKHGEGEGEESSLMFSQEEGWNIQDKYAGINVSDSNGVCIQEGNFNHVISVSEDGISLTDKKQSQSEPAILGDALEEALNNIVNLFDAIQKSAAGNPYTAAISSAINTQLGVLKNSIPNIKSKNVRLN